MPFKTRFQYWFLKYLYLLFLYFKHSLTFSDIFFWGNPDISEIALKIFGLFVFGSCLGRITLHSLYSLNQLKESLEQSIDQLRSQRLLRNSGGRSISVTSLSASDLDGGTGPGKHFKCSGKQFFVLIIFLKQILNTFNFWRNMTHA